MLNTDLNRSLLTSSTKNTTITSCDDQLKFTGCREGREGRRGGGWRWEGGSEEKNSKDNENGTVLLVNMKRYSAKPSAH